MPRSATAGAADVGLTGDTGGAADCKVLVSVLSIDADNDDAAAAFCVSLLAALECLSNNSPIVMFLNDVGMRFTRSSIRVCRLCAWSAYCARSLRARSVTFLRQ